MPEKSHKISGKDCHLISEKLIDMASEKNVVMNGEIIGALSSEI